MWAENDLMAMRMYDYKIHVKGIQTHAQWLDIDMTTVAHVGLGALAVQSLYRPQGTISCPPSHERVAGFDGCGTQSSRGDFQDISTRKHWAWTIATSNPTKG
jgi:hypothetical protein